MKTSYKLRVIVAFCFRILYVFSADPRDGCVTDSLQGDHLLDLPSQRADQIHERTAVTLQHCLDPHLASDLASMVAYLNYNTQPQSVLTVTVSQLGRLRLGLHGKSLRQWHVRNEEHELEANGFWNRYRDSHRHGQEVRYTD